MRTTTLAVLVGLWAVMAPSLQAEYPELLECELPEWQALVEEQTFLSPKLLRKLDEQAKPLMPSAGWKILDIGFVYTAERMSFIESFTSTNVEQLNYDYIEALNAAFARSHMRTFARLVGQSQVPYKGTGDIFRDQNKLRNQDMLGTGPLAGWRDLWGADVLFLEVDYGTGVAWGPYAVIGNWDLGTVVHEAGHAQLLQHTPAMTSALCLSGDEICLRGHGYEGVTLDGEVFTDVMGYGPSRLSQFGDPRIFYKGVPTGEYGVSEAATIGEIVAQEAEHWKPTVSASTCTPSAHRLCLTGERFVVQAFYTRGSRRGYAEATPVGDAKGTLAPEAGSVTVKVTNQCEASGRFNVVVRGKDLPRRQIVEVLILDTANGSVREYTSTPRGKFRLTEGEQFACP